MSFIDALLSALHEFAEWLLGLVQKIFESIWEMLKDVFLWLFDELLTLLLSMISEIDLSGLGSIPAISGLPPEFLNMISLLGIPQDLALIVAALVIRFTLQLIPFTRLGS
jgi:hypothetical protein